MVIRNLKHKYYVIENIDRMDNFHILRCELIDEEAEPERSPSKTSHYDLLEIADEEMMPALVQELTQPNAYQTFQDLFEYFSSDGKFYLAMVHRDASSLRSKLGEEQCSLRERLEIGKNLAERIILLGMPDFLQSAVLHEEQILVAGDLTVSFSYLIDELTFAEEIEFSVLIRQMTAVLEQLFKKEIANKESKDILAFMETCRDYEFKDWLEFYQEYSKLYDAVLTQSEQGFIKPNTFLFVLWEKIKKIFNKLKGIVIKIILLLLFIFMMKSILEKPEPSGVDFLRIGTVEIEDAYTEDEEYVDEDYEDYEDEEYEEPVIQEPDLDQDAIEDWEEEIDEEDSEEEDTDEEDLEDEEDSEDEDTDEAIDEEEIEDEESDEEDSEDEDSEDEEIDEEDGE